MVVEGHCTREVVLNIEKTNKWAETPPNCHIWSGLPEDEQRGGSAPWRWQELTSLWIDHLSRPPALSPPSLNCYPLFLFSEVCNSIDLKMVFMNLSCCEHDHDQSWRKNEPRIYILYVQQILRWHWLIIALTALSSMVWKMEKITKSWENLLELLESSSKARWDMLCSLVGGR